MHSRSCSTFSNLNVKDATRTLRTWHGIKRLLRAHVTGSFDIRAIGSLLHDFYHLSTFTISLAAFAPEPPVNPAPGCVPLPHRYKFSMGVR